MIEDHCSCSMSNLSLINLKFEGEWRTGESYKYNIHTCNFLKNTLLLGHGGTHLCLQHSGGRRRWLYDSEASVVSRASSRHSYSGSVWGSEENLHKQGLSCDSHVLHVANQTASGQFSCLHLPSWRRSARITDPCHCIRLPYVGSSDQTQFVMFALHIDISQPMSGGLTA